MEAKKLFPFLWTTLRADLPSSMHKEAWKKFKENLRIRDTLSLSCGLSNEIISLILGSDSVTQVSKFMEDESNLDRLSDTFIKLWPYAAVLNRVFLVILGSTFFLSLKWQRISLIIFYVGVIYLINEALLGLPDGFNWYLNPSTRLMTMIFAFIDKSLLQAIFVLIFWAFQYIIRPNLYEIEHDLVFDIQALVCLMSTVLCASFIKNLIGMSFCNE